MKLLFFLVACSKAYTRCHQEAIDEGKDVIKMIYIYI